MSRGDAAAATCLVEAVLGMSQKRSARFPQRTHLKGTVTARVSASSLSSTTIQSSSSSSYGGGGSSASAGGADGVAMGVSSPPSNSKLPAATTTPGRAARPSLSASGLPDATHGIPGTSASNTASHVVAPVDRCQKYLWRRGS